MEVIYDIFRNGDKGMRSTENNNQKTRSLIRNLKYVLDIVADGKGLYGERI